MVNYITISKKNYENQFDWEDAIAAAVKVLIENGYVIKMELQEFGIMIIEFDYADYEISERRCVWLTDTELETVIYDEDREDEEE